jgi:transposase-like protein
MAEKSVDIVAGLVIREGVNGRRSYNIAAKRALVELCKGPGVSVAGTALAHGINANLLRRWIVKYSDAKALSVPGTSRKTAVLVPVTTPMPRPTRPSAGADSYIEIIFAAATIRLRGSVDARMLGLVLDCLAQRA